MAGLSQPAVMDRASHAWLRRLVPGRRTMVPATWLIELVLLDVAVAENSLWLLRAVAVLLLAVLPGQLLLRALRIPAASIRRYVAYLPCASVAVLIASTLVVDLVGPRLGVHEPLRRWPLLIGLNLALPGLARLGHRATASCELKSSDLIGRVRWFWPLLLPLASVVAAARLDNGDGNALAIVVLVAVAVMIPACTVLANGMHRRQMNLVLYGSGLALMLLTSMRSSYVIGFDINSEYFDFHQTVVNGIWHFGHLNPYEAMLSLTVLPASLHALIGGQDVWIFKLGYPALFAFFPVAVFSLGTRFLSRRAAFVAAAIVIVQAYFFQQQPEIARQELALLIFAGIMGALLDSSLGRGPQLGLVSVLGVTLVVCHYSTTYITILLCLLASFLVVTVSRRKSAPTSRPTLAHRRGGHVGIGGDLVPAGHSFREQRQRCRPVAPSKWHPAASRTAQRGERDQRLFQRAPETAFVPDAVPALYRHLLRRAHALSSFRCPPPRIRRTTCAQRRLRISPITPRR